jgi:hypothetical protein
MSNSESTSSSESLVVSGSIARARVWIFSILTLAGAGMFLYTWFQPWWTAYIVALKENGITIFPYAMVIGGTLKDYPQWLVGAEMPGWFFRLMWVYLVACMAALLISLFAGEEKVSLGKSRFSLQKVLVGGVGLSYIIIVLGCAIVIAMRAPQFYGASLQGSVFVHMAEHEGNAESYVETSLQLGYWLACSVGPLLLVLALLRDKIIGKPGLNAS